MKNIFFFPLLFMIFSVKAQSPDKMSYQAVIRDSNAAIVSNQIISIKISILLEEPDGAIVYSEKHSVTTSQSGLISIKIGEGTTSDDFTTIDWGSGSYFLRTETDPNGGTNYVITGTTQLISVPYALFSKKAGSFDESDPIFELSTASGITESDTSSWNSKLDSYNESDPIFELSTASGITQSDTTSWNNKLDNYTETQNLEEILSLGNSANSQIKNLLDPTDAQDAVTKEYVDALEDQLFELKYMLGIDSVSDIDGNFYIFVKIENQYWFAENLKTTKYNDGIAIENLTTDNDWVENSAGGYSWYNNDESSYKKIHGALYNWNAVSSGKLCPKGWHVPTNEDWNELISVLGGNEVSGGKLKETGTTNWNSPNVGATDETNFKALPSGSYFIGDGFRALGSVNYIWSSNEFDSKFGNQQTLINDIPSITNYTYPKNYGFSCRCLKD